jgi:hypothetical protein
VPTLAVGVIELRAMGVTLGWTTRVISASSVISGLAFSVNSGRPTPSVTISLTSVPTPSTVAVGKSSAVTSGVISTIVAVGLGIVEAVAFISIRGD